MSEKKYKHNRQAAVVRSMDIVCCRSSAFLDLIDVCRQWEEGQRQGFHRR
jgi:hypothetical protein